MIDTLALPRPLTASRTVPTYTAVAAAPPLADELSGDELSDDDLEQVVGGLARARGASPGTAATIGSSVTVTHSSPAIPAQRISA